MGRLATVVVLRFRTSLQKQEYFVVVVRYVSERRKVGIFRGTGCLCIARMRGGTEDVLFLGMVLVVVVVVIGELFGVGCWKMEGVEGAL